MEAKPPSTVQAQAPMRHPAAGATSPISPRSAAAALAPRHCPLGGCSCLPCCPSSALVCCPKCWPRTSDFPSSCPRSAHSSGRQGGSEQLAASQKSFLSSWPRSEYSQMTTSGRKNCRACLSATTSARRRGLRRRRRRPWARTGWHPRRRRPRGRRCRCRRCPGSEFAEQAAEPPARASSTSHSCSETLRLRMSPLQK